MKIKKILMLLVLIFIITGTNANNGVQLTSTWYRTKILNDRMTAEGTVGKNSEQRIVTLSPHMFNKGLGLRENIESILTIKRAEYKSITPNEDRTVFTVTR